LQARTVKSNRQPTAKYDLNETKAACYSTLTVLGLTVLLVLTDGQFNLITFVVQQTKDGGFSE
jgi:hypothetical protein